MPSVATRPSSPTPAERPEPRRETLHLGWTPTRRIAPVGPSLGPRAAETMAAGARPTPAPTAGAPKSPPPMKGQTGPRPGY